MQALKKISVWDSGFKNSNATVMGTNTKNQFSMNFLA